jgi:hypothetical protein
MHSTAQYGMCPLFGIPSQNALEHLTVYDFDLFIRCLTPALRSGVVSAPLHRREPPIIYREGFGIAMMVRATRAERELGVRAGTGLESLDDAVRVTLGIMGL